MTFRFDTFFFFTLLIRESAFSECGFLGEKRQNAQVRRHILNYKPVNKEETGLDFKFCLLNHALFRLSTSCATCLNGAEEYLL